MRELGLQEMIHPTMFVDSKKIPPISKNEYPVIELERILSSPFYKLNI